MRAIFSKEFKNSMYTMTGPIFIAFVLLIFGIFTVETNLDYGYPGFEYTVSRSAFISLLALPLLTMRSHSEERRTGADKLLYSLPLKTGGIVVSKYLAALAVFAIPTAILFFYPLVLSKFGEVYLNTAWSSLLSYFLVGAVLIAVGEFISSLTESQVIAAIFSFGAIFLLFMVGNDAGSLPQTSSFSLLFLILLSLAVALVAWALTKNVIAGAVTFGVGAASSLVAFFIDRTAYEGLATRWISSLDLFGRAQPFFMGVIDLTAIVYYLSLTVFFLFLTALSVDKRRWS